MNIRLKRADRPRLNWVKTATELHWSRIITDYRDMRGTLLNLDSEEHIHLIKEAAEAHLH